MASLWASFRSRPLSKRNAGSRWWNWRLQRRSYSWLLRLRPPITRDRESPPTKHHQAYPKVGFPESISSLGGGKGCKPSAQTACLISNSVASGSDRGFNFAAKGETPINGANTTFAAGAAPAKYSSTGTHLFCAMQDGKVRWDNNLGQSTKPPDSNLCPQFSIL